MSAELAGKAYVEMSVKGKEQFAKSFAEMQASIKSFSSRMSEIGRGNATGNLKKALSSVVSGFKGMAQAAMRYGAIAGAALAAGLVAFLGQAIKKASDLQETMNKFNVVFGSNAQAMEQWGVQFASQMGRSRNETLKFMADMQGFVVPMGVDPQQAMQMSQSLTQLSYDLASFNNVSDADAFQALMSAISGEAEPMKRFGVIVNETAVKAELLKRGIDPTTANEAQKAMARYNIILQGTAMAQGDVERSSDSYANRLKALQAAWDDLSAQIGTMFMPVAEILLGWLKDFITQLGLSTGSIDGTSQSLEGLGGSGSFLMTVVGGLIKFWNALGFVINGAVFLLRKFFSLMVSVAKLATNNPVTKKLFGTENIEMATAALQAAQDELEKGAGESWDAMNKNIDVFGPDGVEQWMAGFGDTLRNAREKAKESLGGGPDGQQPRVTADMSQIEDLTRGNQAPDPDALRQQKIDEIQAQMDALRERTNEVATPQALEANTLAALEKFRENQQNEMKAIQQKQLANLERMRKAIEDPDTAIVAIGD